MRRLVVARVALFLAATILFLVGCGDGAGSSRDGLDFEAEAAQLCEQLQEGLFETRGEQVEYRIAAEMDTLGCPIVDDPRTRPNNPPGGDHPNHRDGFCDDNDRRRHCQTEHFGEYCGDDDDIRFWCHEARYHRWNLN